MTTYYALSGFQRDILHAIAAVTTTGNEPYGLALKRWLDGHYAEPVNHSRLYKNLDQLADKELINCDSLDARTNVYTLTDTGRQCLETKAKALARVYDHRWPVANGGN